MRLLQKKLNGLFGQLKIIVTFITTDWTFLFWTSYKWNYMACSLACLAPFTEQVFEIHPCCWIAMYYSIIWMLQPILMRRKSWVTSSLEFMNICEYVLVFICTYYVGYIPNSNTIRINEVSEVTEYNIKIQKVTVFLNTSTLIETKVWKKHLKNQILKNKFNYRFIKPLHRKPQDFAEPWKTEINDDVFHFSEL